MTELIGQILIEILTNVASLVAAGSFVPRAARKGRQQSGSNGQNQCKLLWDIYLEYNADQ
jgi:hypothetical protein